MGHQLSDYTDHVKEAEEFEATKAGVKGLVDSGITKIPSFFIRPSSSETLSEKTSKECNEGKSDLQLQIPIIDLQGVENDGGARRAQIVEEIHKASEGWGIFQLVNHGVPQGVMNAILEATRRFHEQQKELKMDLHCADSRRNVRFYTIDGSFRRTHVAGWRDALACHFKDGVLDPEAIPLVCRNEILDYMENTIKLKELLSELLSEALGLSRDYLASIECLKTGHMTCLYYPACPQPELTFGSFEHSDSTSLTFLVQDSMGGLQVLHQDHWVDVPPIPGAVIVNLGDVLQLLTNDKFKSVVHRVLVSSDKPRISAACFFFPGSDHIQKPYGPIKELLSESNPPIYREVPYSEFVNYYYQKMVREGVSALDHFMLSNNTP